MDRRSNHSPVLNSVIKRNSLPLQNDINSRDEKSSSQFKRSGERNSKNGKCVSGGSFSSDSKATAPKSGCETKPTSSLPVAKDESKISQGILLNAAHFVGSDEKEQNSSHFLEFGDNCLKLSEPKSEEKHGEGKDEPETKMTALRKIAFGFSLFPSVMFVLCFAVILPCIPNDVSKSCFQRKWSTVLNETAVRTELLVDNHLLLGCIKNTTEREEYELLSLDFESGKKQWDLYLESEPQLIDCSVLDANEDGFLDCILVLEGALYAFNLSDGHMFWKYRESEMGEVSSPLLILPGCFSSNGFKTIGIATASVNDKWRLQIMDAADRSVLETKEVTPEVGCSSPHLISWKRGNATDLILSCKYKNNTGIIKVLRQEDWCSFDGEKSNDFNPPLFISLNLQQSEVVISPTNDGILIFGTSRVAFFQANASKQWEINTDSQFYNRYARYGRFNGTDQQIALVQDSILNGSAVIVVNKTDGNILNSFALPIGHVVDTIVLREKKQDHLLVCLLKSNTTDKGSALKENVAFSDNVTLGPPEKYFVSNESSASKGNELTLELIVLQFDGKNSQSVIYSGKVDFHHVNGEPYTQELKKLKLIVSSEDQEKLKAFDLVITETYAGSSNGEDHSFTKLYDLEFKNWDTSDETYVCK